MIQSLQERDLAPQRAAVNMNKYDQQRKQDLIKALVKSKEKAEIHKLYLKVNERDPEEVATAHLVLEHIEIALQHLGVLVAAED